MKLAVDLVFVDQTRNFTRISYHSTTIQHDFGTASYLLDDDLRLLIHFLQLRTFNWLLVQI